MKAGYCNECQAYVWLDADGNCVSGHSSTSITGVYESTPQAQAPVPSIRKELPRWLAAIWGLALVVLNAFVLLYVLGFALTMSSMGGPGIAPQWVVNLFFGDGPGVMFQLVGYMLVLTISLMALSYAHIFAWSGLPMERKALWAVICFVGAQPGLLAYWFMNVWREWVPGTQPAERPDTVLRRIWLVILGVLTVLPGLYFAFFFFSVSNAMGGAEPDSLFFRYLPALHMGTILLVYFLIAVYLIDVFRTPRLDTTMKVVWAGVIAFAGPIAWPVYWYLNLWRKPKSPAQIEAA